MKQAWKNDIDHRSRAYTGIAPEEFKVGAKCLVFTPQRSKHTSDKLQSAWKGPYIISEKLSDILYRVKADPNNIVRQRPPKGIVTLSRLKLAEGKGNDQMMVTPTMHQQMKNDKKYQTTIFHMNMKHYSLQAAKIWKKMKTIRLQLQ